MTTNQIIGLVELLIGAACLALYDVFKDKQTLLVLFVWIVALKRGNSTTQITKP